MDKKPTPAQKIAALAEVKQHWLLTTIKFFPDQAVNTHDGRHLAEIEILTDFDKLIGSLKEKKVTLDNLQNAMTILGSVIYKKETDYTPSNKPEHQYSPVHKFFLPDAAALALTQKLCDIKLGRHP